MKKTCYLYCLFINIFLVSVSAYSQTINFDETWKEFLVNNKISDMSVLYKPDKERDPLNYAKYLLMNTNTDFCQSNVKKAENLMTEIGEIDERALKSIPGYMGKMEELETKIKAYYSMDVIWKQFLQSKEVNLENLEAVAGAKTSCEKQTLAKYSYMQAYYHFCKGDISTSQDIFENRTLRLAEKTSLRVEDVEGLATEVAKMKSLFQNMSKLENAWKEFLETDVSPGLDFELPLFICNPIPNMKEYILKGAADQCHSGPTMLDNINKVQAKSGVMLDWDMEKKVKALKAAIEQDEAKLSALNKAWKAFIPDNKVKIIDYGYDYCDREALIRAYIMDGFGSVCIFAESSLRKIDSLQRAERTPLEKITMTKIDELEAFYEKHESNGKKIDRIWNDFVAAGDRLLEAYESTDLYCDYVQLVKDWTMKGLWGTCEEGIEYLEKVEEVNKTFDWVFYEDLECRVQKLRFKVWDCRYQALKKLASLEASPESVDERLEELMIEYGMGERPPVCKLDK